MSTKKKAASSSRKEAKKAKKAPPKRSPYAKKKPRKARPKLAPKRKRKTATVKTEIIPVQAEDGRYDRQYIRHVAGLLYTTSSEKMSLSILEKHPLMVQEGVTVASLERWSRDDDWVARRQTFLENLRKGLEKQIGTELSRARVEFLDGLYSVREDLLDKLSTNAAKPNSYEGLVNALVKLSDQIDKMQEKLAGSLVPQSFDVAPGSTSALPGEAVQQMTPKLSPAEARAGALAIVRKRREDLRQKLAQSDEDGPPVIIGPDQGAAEGETA